MPYMVVLVVICAVTNAECEWAESYVRFLFFSVPYTVSIIITIIIIMMSASVKTASEVLKKTNAYPQ